VLVILIALLAGCSSSATTSTKATSTQSASAAASTPAAAHTFTSRHYGYAGALPAGWSSDVQATQQWNGQGAPGDDDSVVDLFSGPGGVEAWAMAAPTKQSLQAYTTATTRASAAAHPCPATPQTDQAITASEQEQVFGRIMQVLPETIEIAADITVHLARRRCQQ
jgi:hypothetical protein